jgi:coenzyme F420-reducing hydrogenase beta subunit
MKEICKPKHCLNCLACSNICPSNAVVFCNDYLDSPTAFIDESKCVGCGMCKKVCPQLNEIVRSTPKKCYAAWSSDENTRKNSASGGISYELYKTVVSNGGCAVGVENSKTHEPIYQVYESPDDIKNFQNSKYVHSNMGIIYKNILDLLNAGRKVMFVGLPCQVASLKLFLNLKHANIDCLWCADLICHGTAPFAYLEQHINEINKKHKTNTKRIFYRDPRYGTDNFYFSLYGDKNKPYYKKAVYSLDAFQIGYHNGIIYQSSCYQYKYASHNRCGDITLSDYSGLGNLYEFKAKKEKVSCVLINTKKGEELINLLIGNGSIISIERPTDEILTFEKRLASPTPVTPFRESFEKYYATTHSFETAMKKSYYFEAKKKRNKYYLSLGPIKRVVKKILGK